MQLGLNFGYQDWGTGLSNAVQLSQIADQLGYRSLWTAEAYGTDAITPLTWLLARTERVALGTAIMQMPARTPAMTAMTAATLDMMSGGRFLCGLGASGPQVVEGWHGTPYGKPLARTREYVEIVRAALRREKPLEHDGEHYQIPYRAPDATGLGKPLKLIVRPTSEHIPLYLAAIGPRNVELAAEIADGWLPVLLSPYRLQSVFGDSLERGRKLRRASSADPFDIAASVPILLGDDVENLIDKARPGVALYVGGMGAKGKNFYNDLACRYGYEDAAERIQDLYLDGQRRDAIAAVPAELVDEVALIGPPARIRDRLGAWRESGVTTLVAMTSDPAAVRLLAETVL